MSLHKCTYAYQRGKAKGSICSNDALKSHIGIYCPTHQKISAKKTINSPIKDVAKCTTILASGKRKGQECGCQIKDVNTTSCKRHASAAWPTFPT